uniref:Uncharacterized protein n=1 Tax=Anopheles coluzzii TaxID=1518534 RepID=A0A8W7P910_ANOCL
MDETRHFSSSRANFWPMQFLGPALNGMYAYGWRFSAVRSGRKRSGSKVSASGKNLQRKRSAELSAIVKLAANSSKKKRILPLVPVHVVRVDADDGTGRHVIPAERDVLAGGAAEERDGRVEAQRFLQAALEQPHRGQVLHRGGSVASAKDGINFLMDALLHLRMEGEQKQGPAHPSRRRVVALWRFYYNHHLTVLTCRASNNG